MNAFETLTLAPIDRRLIELNMLAPDELDPWQATTYGTGQLICVAATYH